MSENLVILPWTWDVSDSGCSIMARPIKKQKISATIDLIIVNEIEKIKDTTKYAKRSSVTNEILKQGLEALGIKLEA
jgi:hypothetical protein